MPRFSSFFETFGRYMLLENGRFYCLFFLPTFILFPILYHFPKGNGGIGISCVTVYPGGDGFPVFWQSLQIGQWSHHPIAGAQDERYHPCFSFAMAFKGIGNFFFIKIVGSNGLGTDQKEDEVSFVQMFFDGLCPNCAGFNFAVVPDFHPVGALERSEVQS